MSLALPVLAVRVSVVSVPTVTLTAAGVNVSTVSPVALLISLIPIGTATEISP